MSDLSIITDSSCILASIIGTLITSATVILGWWVTNNHANNRQVRNEQLAKKEELCRELDQLDNAIREYYVGAQTKHNLAKFEIDARFSRLSEMIEHIRQVHDNAKIYEKFTALFEATTDGSFGSENISNEVFEEKYKRILLVKELLYSEIEATFGNKN